MWMNQGGLESAEHSTCRAAWPLCNKSFGKQVFFSKWGLSSRFSCETWQMGHSESDRPLLSSSADSSFTQMSAETFTGARRGSGLLSHVQPRESITSQLSACSIPPQKRHSTPASQPRFTKTAQNWTGAGVAVSRHWRRELLHEKFTKEQLCISVIYSFIKTGSLGRDVKEFRDFYHGLVALESGPSSDFASTIY